MPSTLRPFFWGYCGKVFLMRVAFSLHFQTNFRKVTWTQSRVYLFAKYTTEPVRWYLIMPIFLQIVKYNQHEALHAEARRNLKTKNLRTSFNFFLQFNEKMKRTIYSASMKWGLSNENWFSLLFLIFFEIINEE